MNNTIRTLIKRGQKLHKMAKRQNTEDSWSKLRKVRNEVITYIRKEHNKKLTDTINSSNVSENTPLIPCKTVFRFFHSYHNPPMEHLTTISKKCPITSSIQNQTSNSKTQANIQLQFRSKNQPNTSLPLAFLVAAHLIMTFIEKTS